MEEPPKDTVRKATHSSPAPVQRGEGEARASSPVAGPAGATPAAPAPAAAGQSVSPVERATVTGMAELLLLGLDERGGGGPSGVPPGLFAPENWIGRLVGDYRIEQELGRGGMGAVFRATNVRVGSTVALKLLRFAPGESAERLRRFEFEARAAAQLNHPRIINVFDVGQVGDLYYLAMEYVEGRPLSELIRAGPLEAPTAVQIMRDVCEALEFAHAQGVIHRDIKPSNILIEPSGAAQLMDFGLARRLDEARRLTEAGVIMGTLQYMSPEQARGQSHEADRRSDIYSLGVVLYEMLTGALPFHGQTSVELLRRICFDDPPRPRRRRPKLDHDLETIILKAMERTPARRYASAAALSEDLRRYAAGEPILAQRPSWPYRAQKFLKRHRFCTWSAAVTVLSVLMVTLGFLLHDQRLVTRLRAEARDRETSALRAPALEGWRWMHALRLAGRLSEALEVLGAESQRAAADAAGPAREAERRLWRGILLAELSPNGARSAPREWTEARRLAQGAGRPEVALAASAYLGEAAETGAAGLAAEARALLAYHRGHAAWLRGALDEARREFTLALELCPASVEGECALIERERLAEK